MQAERFRALSIHRKYLRSFVFIAFFRFWIITSAGTTRVLPIKRRPGPTLRRFCPLKTGHLVRPSLWFRSRHLGAVQRRSSVDKLLRYINKIARKERKWFSNNTTQLSRHFVNNLHRNRLYPSQQFNKQVKWLYKDHTLTTNTSFQRLLNNECIFISCLVHFNPSDSSRWHTL